MYYRTMPYYEPRDLACLLSTKDRRKSARLRAWLSVAANLVLAPQGSRHGEWL